MLNDPDAWMRTKPQMQTKLYYVANDTVRSVPKTENRAKAVSNLFYETEREAYIALKNQCEAKAQFYCDQIKAIEIRLATEGK
jgi:hypothetical protein